MQYASGEWVQRDDSNGPMATGGYPFKVKELSKATRWETPEAALKYRAVGQDWDWTLHRLEMTTVKETITPAMEAAARGDEEFKEFQRLAKKYGLNGTGECPFNRAWIGKCKKVPAVGELYCDDHKELKCFKCGAQATADCSHAGQFVCGVPHCAQHNHH